MWFHTIDESLRITDKATAYNGGDNKNCPKEDGASTQGPFGWAVNFEKADIDCELWKSCYELRAVKKAESCGKS